MLSGAKWCLSFSLLPRWALRPAVRRLSMASLPEILRRRRRLGITTSLPLISGRPTYRASWILMCHSTCARPQMSFPSISTGARWCAGGCALRRSLYGLKQAGREWAALFSSFLITWGMTRSTIDPCLYVFQAAESILWVCVYVDEGLTRRQRPRASRPLCRQPIR